MAEQQLFGLFVGVPGGVLAVNALKMFRASRRRDEYEPVTARILDSQLETDSNRQHSTSPSYIPEITYEYTVGDETYTGDNVYPGPATSGSTAKDEQQALLDEFPEGATVQAFYDPGDPAASFLEHESRTRQAAGTGILGALLLGFGCVLILGLFP